jgi:hypothetical protein
MWLRRCCTILVHRVAARQNLGCHKHDQRSCHKCADNEVCPEEGQLVHKLVTTFVNLCNRAGCRVHDRLHHNFETKLFVIDEAVPDKRQKQQPVREAVVVELQVAPDKTVPNAVTVGNCQNIWRQGCALLGSHDLCLHQVVCILSTSESRERRPVGGDMGAPIPIRIGCSNWHSAC